MRAEQAYLAVCFLRQANRERHGNLVIHLENCYTMGDNKYPRTVTEAYNLLLRYRNQHYARGGGGGGEVEGVTLNTVSGDAGQGGGGNNRQGGGITTPEMQTRSAMLVEKWGIYHMIGLRKRKRRRNTTQIQRYGKMRVTGNHLVRLQ